MNTQWAAFQHVSKAFEYPGAKLEKAWNKLHVGDLEPFPDTPRIRKLIGRNAKLGKLEDAALIATTLQDAWRAFHRGDFERAHKLGAGLGALGATVANKAMGIHATYLVTSEADRLERYEAIAKRAEEAAKALPEDANAHYFRAYALGRYSQAISILKALAQGIAGKVKTSLDKALELAPRHAEAHLALALYHAEIVTKVGRALADFTYGAKSICVDEHLKAALDLAPEVPIVHVEMGNAYVLQSRDDEAALAYMKAGKLQPRDANDALDIAFAKEQIE